MQYNKQINQDKKQLVFAPASLILTNYFLPLNEALYLLFIIGVQLINLAKKSLLLFCAALLCGCATTTQKIERKNYFPWENDTGYTQVVKTDNTLYISGITSEKVSFKDQVDDIYTNIKKMLADYGVGTEAIVKEVIFTTDIEKLKSAIPTRKAYFDGKYPSASWVEVKRLWSESHFLEVEIVVVLP
jgi:2-iminobutanoate/2-iminopropanoate deaminase